MNNEIVVLTKILREFAKLTQDGKERVLNYLSSAVASGESEATETAEG